MHIVSKLVFASVAVLAADGQPRELAPTPLEAFAGKPGAIVVWSRAVGHLEGPAARATAVAIAIEDVTNTVMRGLRLDLTHLRANPDCNQRFLDWAILCARPDAAIYLDEAHVGRVRARLMEIGAATVHPESGSIHGGITTYRTSSSGSGSFGLIITGYTLAGRRAEELVDLLARGIEALKEAPR
jgi:hypothetical protein